MGVLLSWTNLAETAPEISCDSEAAGLGLRALLTPQIADVWRSDGWGAATITLDVDLGADRDVRVVAIAAPRDGLLPSASATVRLTASTVSASGTEALDTSAVAFGMTAAAACWAWCGAAAPVSARYWRLAFAGTSGDAYLQLGRLWIGPALVTSRAVSYGWREAAQDSGITSRSALSGIRDARRGRGLRQVEWPLLALTSTDAAEVARAATEAATTGQVYGARDHLTPSAGLFGAFAAPPSVQRIAYPVWSTTLSIIEDL